MVAALYDRTFMQLSDRGGASNLVGEQWAALCAGALMDSSPGTVPVRTGPDDVVATTTVRLDHIPAIARVASRNKLQNPDFLMIGPDHDGDVLWAADAKFSVETARARQVSDEVVESLLGLGDLVRGLLPPQAEGATVRNGVFICPDAPLTHRLLTVRTGPRRATVSPRDVRLLALRPADMFDPLGLRDLQEFLAGMDRLPFSRETSLLVALYYFRVTRAAVGCWLDQTAPLLAYHDVPKIDETAVADTARQLASRVRTSAWGFILRWNDEVDQVRRQRAAIEEVTALPVRNRLLRQQVEETAARAGAVAPSMSKVRRLVGSWYRARIRDEFGPILPPVEDFGSVLDAIGRYCRSLEWELATTITRVIEELVTAPPAAEDGVWQDSANGS